MITTNTRQIVLDTETTGINQVGACYKGHRIIEIGAIEIINRRLTGCYYHVYTKPDRPVDPEAYSIHGISDEFLLDKPTFDQVADEFFNFIYGSELVIHNSVFDIGFIDQEFRLLQRGIPKTETFCTITDSLLIASRLFPGKRNNLNALCSRYAIDNSKRTLHGALLDAEILAEIYLAMTGGQTSMIFQMEGDTKKTNSSKDIQRITYQMTEMKVLYASDKELLDHEERLDLVEQKGGMCLWRKEDVE